MSRVLLLLLLMHLACFSQLSIVDPNLQATWITSGIPGAWHQVGTDSTGNIYVADEVPGGGFGYSIHRIDAQGNLSPHWISGVNGPASVGQMVTNPADGLCYFVSHWQGGLVHNNILRIETAGSLTMLNDILWGIGHGFTMDGAGDWFMGNSSGFQPAVIHHFPAGGISSGPVSAWSPGQGVNGFLAAAEPGTLLCADGNSVWRITPGQPNSIVYTHVPAPGASLAWWRGLIRCPFGEGHIVSLLETITGSGMGMARVVWLGPGGARELANCPFISSEDFCIGADGDQLLVMSQGNLVRLSLIYPHPIPPGQLIAPSNPVTGAPFNVLIVGTPFALSPFLLAADVPLGPPLFPGGVFPLLPLGVFHTSLGVQPTFVPIVDGLGLYLPTDPTGFTDASGTWSRVYALPASLLGTTFVLEACIVDDQAPNGLFWITNPVFVTGI